MPNWVKLATNTSQLVIVGMAIAATVWLALARVIGGDTAVALLLAITGAGSIGATVTHKVIDQAQDIAVKTANGDDSGRLR